MFAVVARLGAGGAMAGMPIFFLWPPSQRAAPTNGEGIPKDPAETA